MPPGERTPRRLDPPRLTWLTEAEHDALRLTAQLASAVRRVIGDGPSAGDDWREAAHLIHGLQNMLLAQAAGRAYPMRYRLLGRAMPAGFDTTAVVCRCGARVPAGGWEQHRQDCPQIQFKET